MVGVSAISDERRMGEIGNRRSYTRAHSIFDKLPAAPGCTSHLSLRLFPYGISWCRRRGVEGTLLSVLPPAI